MKRNSSRQKTVTRTFRIRREWDEILQEEAETQGLSVSVLLNQMSRKYSRYSRWADRYNDVNLSQQALREILKAASLEKLADAGKKSGATDFINTVNAIGLKNEYDSFVYMVTDFLGGHDYARWFRCFHHQHGDTDIFHLQHDLGYGWSTFISNYLTSGLKSLTGIEPETQVRDYSVNIQVNLPRIEPLEKAQKIIKVSH